VAAARESAKQQNSRQYRNYAGIEAVPESQPQVMRKKGSNRRKEIR
jgi:hypothetical protein